MSVRIAARCMASLVTIWVLGAGCASFGASDPRVAGPRNDRWEVVIAQPRVAVFDVARQVLADSGYVLAQSNLDLGVISTADRRTSTIDPLTRQPVTVPGEYPVLLSLAMTPLGRDSTRLSISGQYRPGNEGTVNARSSEWRLVQGIGEAILARLR